MIVLDRHRRGWLLAAAAAGLLAGGAVVYRWSPQQYRFFPPCLFHVATGLYCPGCGMTRGVHALLHAQWRQALAYNALIGLALPLTGYYALLAARAWLRGQPVPQRPWPGWVTAGLVAAAVSFAVLRNLPWGPCRWLAPHGL